MTGAGGGRTARVRGADAWPGLGRAAVQGALHWHDDWLQVWRFPSPVPTGGRTLRCCASRSIGVWMAWISVLRCRGRRTWAGCTCVQAAAGPCNAAPSRSSARNSTLPASSRKRAPLDCLLYSTPGRARRLLSNYSPSSKVRRRLRHQRWPLLHCESCDSTSQRLTIVRVPKRTPRWGATALGRTHAGDAPPPPQPPLWVRVCGSSTRRRPIYALD